MDWTHIILWAAFITCLLKPKNFILALSFILFHFLVIDVISQDYIFIGVKLSVVSWLLFNALVSFFYSCITYMSKNYYVLAIFLLNFFVMSYIYIVTPEQASNFLWHGYGTYYYNNLFSINIAFWLGLAPFLALMVENVRSYFDRNLSIVNHIKYSHSELFTYIKNETMALYKENKKVLFDPYFKKAGDK